MKLAIFRPEARDRGATMMIILLVRTIWRAVIRISEYYLQKVGWPKRSYVFSPSMVENGQFLPAVVLKRETYN
jgi:hypothetical protein